MRHLITTLIAGALFSLFLSCGKTYTTYLEQDNFFEQKGVQVGHNAEQRRGEHFSSAVGIQPEKSETYKNFENRLLNTLVIQEHDMLTYNELIEIKSIYIEDLQRQLNDLKQQNRDLRVQYQIASGERTKEVYDRLAFQSYHVEKGDTLQKIARKFYGTYSGWLALYQFNQFYLKSPNMISEGDLLWVPSFENF